MSSAHNPVLRLSGNEVKTGLMALPFTYRHNQISHDLHFGPHQVKEVILVVRAIAGVCGARLYQFGPV